MNGELAQRIALVAWGNAYVRGAADDPPDLLASNSTFKYAGELFRRGSGPQWSLDQWLRIMRTERRTLRLIDGMFIATHAAETEPWSVHWGATAEHSALLQRRLQGERPEWPLSNQRIWAVTYSRALGPPPIPPRESLEQARQALSAALLSIEEFSRQVDAGLWTAWFQEALTALESPQPAARFHDDALPRIGYETQARQLFAAAVNAWVFGGMGSWNDQGFPGREAEYRNVTDDLYTSVIRALAVAVNSWPF